MFTLKQIIKITQGKLSGPYKPLVFNGISTDSRTIKPGNLFIAISGKNFGGSLDGHDFVKDAIKKGAKAVIVSKNIGKNFDVSIIKTKDTVKAYGAIAKEHRKKFNIPIVAITGSNGKTTTKNMVKSILSQTMNALSPEQGFNNQIGVPATLLKLNKNHNAGIFELGTNAPGEIAYLTSLINPLRAAGITNITTTHLEKLKTISGIIKEKSAILNQTQTAVLNLDDPSFRVFAKKCDYEIISFGIKTQSDIKANNIKINKKGQPSFDLIFNNKKQARINLPCLGIYNIYNALTAVGLAYCLNVDFKAIKYGLENYEIAKMRMQLIEKNNFFIINDAYNSNPYALKSALNFLSNFKNKGKKIAVLGNMLELGKKAKELHQEIGQNLPQNIDVLITTGKLAKQIGQMVKNNSCQIKHLSNNKQIINYLNKTVQKNDVVLFKASRRIKLENIIHTWLQ